MKFIADQKRGKRRIAPAPLTAMIDVVFLLLIYFLLTVNVVPPEGALTPSLEVQQRSSGTASDIQAVIVHVGLFEGEPGFLIGTRVLRSKEELTTILERLPASPGVFVRGSGDVTVSWIAAALQAARDAGYSRVTYVPERAS